MAVAIFPLARTVPVGRVWRLPDWAVWPAVAAALLGMVVAVGLLTTGPLNEAVRFAGRALWSVPHTFWEMYGNGTNGTGAPTGALGTATATATAAAPATAAHAATATHAAATHAAGTGAAGTGAAASGHAGAGAATSPAGGATGTAPATAAAPTRAG